MSITVCISTYGDESWYELAFQRAVPSVRDQTDDWIVHWETEGTITSARNNTAGQAVGDWLCFLDADDELGPGYVEAMQRAIRRERRDDGSPLLLTPAVRQILPNGRRKGPFFFPECSLRTGNWLIIGTLIRRDFFFQVGGFRDFPHGLEDWNLWARCVAVGAEIRKVPQAHYIAHLNPDSKHNEIRRNPRAFLRAYRAARDDAWPRRGRRKVRT